VAANYPNADPSFGTKATGNTIEAAHVNALQDEVVAIGAAVRGTLQHDVTLAAGKNLAVGGSASFSSLVSAPAQPRCAVVSTATTMFTSTAYVGFNFTAQDYNIGGMHSTASNSSAVTIASSGTYFLNARAQRSAGGSTTGVVTITVNGASVATQFLPNSFAAAIALTHVARLQVNDAVSLAVLMSDTSGTQFGGGATGTDARLEVVRLY
jgi:hypothetical protein